MQTTRFAWDIEKNFNFNFELNAFKLETKLLKRKLKKKKENNNDRVHDWQRNTNTKCTIRQLLFFFFNSRWTLNQSRR